MKELDQDNILAKIESIWQDGKAWPDFTETMRRAIYGGQAEHQQLNTRTSKWALMPGLCCQAAGGVLYWADYLAAAWFLFYTGASIMDRIEDRDELETYWEKLGPGVALNAASGLFFSAALALENLRSERGDDQSTSQVIQYFHQSFLKMSSGQHRDLLQSEPNLDKYWQTVSAKSGVFFALAGWCGARLATDSPEKLDLFHQFGEQVGILVQIMDDLEDLKSPDGGQLKFKKGDISRSLPVVYAREVLTKAEGQQLRACLKSASEDPAKAQEALDLLNQSGAVLYILTEIEAHRERALATLRETDPQPEAGRHLASLVTDLAPRL